MALTAAERQKRYRNKIKQDKEKYEQHKKKELVRLAKINKKINELTEDEKKERRKKWREQKQKQKEKSETTLCEDNEVETSLQDFNQKVNKVTQSLNKRYRILYKDFKEAFKKVKLQQTALNTVRKKLYRQTKTYVEEIMSLKAENKRLRARQELLESSLREVYADCKTPAGKQIIKEVPLNIERKTDTVSDPKLLGLKGRIRVSKKTIRRPVHEKIMTEMTKFFTRDDISRCTAGKKETRTRKNHKMQIRYLVDTLNNLYQIYKDEGGKYSYATFFRYKPFYVLSPGASSRDTCMCIKHANMELLFEALKKKGVISHPNITDLLKDVVCDTKSYACMSSKCENCKNTRIKYNEDKFQEEVIWRQWVREDHKYEKNDGEHTTKKTVKNECRGLVCDVVAEFKRQLNLFKIHMFNWGEQYRQYKECVTGLKEEEIVILMDFSENYDTKYGKEVQQRHFGASKQSITLHTGVIFFQKCCQSFVTTSDDNCHEPYAIWAHLLPIIKLAKEINPNVKVVHYFSDGPSSQYRQKKNFFLLNFFTEKLKLSYATWSFSEAGHGKSLADGIGGAVKRQLDKRVLYGEDVINATDAYRILQRTMKTVKSFIVSSDDIKNIKNLMPEGLRAVPGTMKLHQVISTELNEIEYRQLSCFCGKMRGLCSCHGPKTHRLVPEKIMKEIFSVELPVSVTSVINELATPIMHQFPVPSSHSSVPSGIEQSIKQPQNASTSLASVSSDPLLGQSSAPVSLEQIIPQIDISLREPETATEKLESSFDCSIQPDDICLPLEITEQFERTFDFPTLSEDICIPFENSMIIDDVVNSKIDLIDTYKLSSTSAHEKQVVTLKPTDLLPPRIKKRVRTLKPNDLFPPPIKKRVKTLRPHKSISTTNDNLLVVLPPVEQNQFSSKVSRQEISNPLQGITPHPVIDQQIVIKLKENQHDTKLPELAKHVTPSSDVTPDGNMSLKVNLSHNSKTLKPNITLHHKLSVSPAKQNRTLLPSNSITKIRVSSTRTFPCHLCKTRQPFILHQMIQCLVCKNWVCSTCSGPGILEYICDICLEV
ncbi:hypothetical protein O0L34_g19420 [Tuta absoluta]|nr:hypothetical protein O0L34_g19420 [Tuta absoluta]